MGQATHARRTGDRALRENLRRSGGDFSGAEGGDALVPPALISRTAAPTGHAGKPRSTSAVMPAAKLVCRARAFVLLRRPSCFPFAWPMRKITKEKGHPAWRLPSLHGRQVRESGPGFSPGHRATAPALPQLRHPCPRHGPHAMRNRCAVGRAKGGCTRRLFEAMTRSVIGQKRTFNAGVRRRRIRPHRTSCENSRLLKTGGTSLRRPIAFRSARP